MDVHKLKIKNNNFNRKLKKDFEPKDPSYKSNGGWSAVDEWNTDETGKSVNAFLRELRILPTMRIKTNLHFYRNSAATLWSADEKWRTLALKKLSSKEFAVLKSLKNQVRGEIVSVAMGIL